MLRRVAMRVGLLLATVLVTVSCGARTGLYGSDASFADHRDASFAVDGDAESLEPGASVACIAAMASEQASAAEAGTQCTVSPQILQCDVASTGDHDYPNYCATTSPDCTPDENPSCQTQCSSGEFGVLCPELTLPGAQGCRVLWPASDPGPSGLVFCCSC